MKDKYQADDNCPAVERSQSEAICDSFESQHNAISHANERLRNILIAIRGTVPEKPEKAEGESKVGAGLQQGFMQKLRHGLSQNADKIEDIHSKISELERIFSQ